MSRGRSCFIVVFLVLLFSPALSNAAQSARVTSDNAEIRSTPQVGAGVLAIVKKGDLLVVGSEPVKGADGDVWYKTRLMSGQFGYVREIDVLSETRSQVLRTAGIQLQTVHPVATERRSWSWVLRGMGFAGYRPSFTLWVYGGELELNYSFLKDNLGYEHRMLAFGPAFMVLRDTKILMGSFVYRIFSPTRLEPEARLRAGGNLDTHQFVAGLNAGVRYPFSLDLGLHMEGYLEGGSLLSCKSSQVPDNSFDLFLSAGLGLHF